MSEPIATPGFDILGIGCCALDEILQVPSWPAADGKVQVTGRQRRLGGLTGASLLAAARLGARCAYAGCLGLDAASEFAAAHLAREGIDVSHAPRLPEAGVVQSTIVIGEDSGSRNIFFSVEGRIGAHALLPSEEVIRAAKVLFLDHLGMEGNLRAATIARGAGIPIVADLEDESHPLFPDVLEAVDHLVLCAEMAQRLTGFAEPSRAARALWRESRQAVIVTCGAEGCWCVTARGAEPRHYPAFAVRAVDTSGCGDVFHGGYTAALARGLPAHERIRFASAAAAVKATHAELTGIEDVRALMESQPFSP